MTPPPTFVGVSKEEKTDAEKCGKSDADKSANEKSVDHCENQVEAKKQLCSRFQKNAKM